MTQNQINYWNYRETNRHNLVTEQETQRHNLATEGETNRHNVAQEGIDLAKLNEAIRSNTASERMQQLNLIHQQQVLAENERSNKERERLQDKQIEWGSAIDMAKLSETTRHNQAAEGIDMARVGVMQQEAAEAARHNLELERSWQVQHKEEQARIRETERANKARESLQADQQSVEKLRILWDQSNKSNLTTAQIREIANKIKIAEENLAIAKEAQTYENIEKATRAAKNAADAVESISSVIKGK